MSTVHCYIAVQNLNLTAGQKTNFWGRMAALGDNDHPNPSHRNHSVTSGVKTIFEAEFTDTEVSVSNLKTLLGLTLSVDPATITAAASETSQGIRITLTESAQAKVQFDVFGYSAKGAGRPTKLESNIQALAYIAATWGGGTLVTGMPRIDPDWERDVSDWWDTHPLNPSGYYPLDVIYPSTVIDVEVDYAGNLQNAINAADAGTGAKLVLGAAYYNGDYVIDGKSHLHFVGQGEAATSIKTINILGGTPWTDTNTAWVSASSDLNNGAAQAIVNGGTHDFYFYNLTFDGNSQTLTEDENDNPVNQAIHLRGVKDVLIDHCTFQNYTVSNPVSATVVPIIVHGLCDNVFFRWCTLNPPALSAAYLDGVFGSGFVNCSFPAKYNNWYILYLCNNDYTFDYDDDGTLQDDEMRNSSYIIVDNNTFTTPFPQRLLNITASHILIRDNAADGYVLYGTHIDAYPSNKARAYDITDVQVLDNTITDCQYLLELDGNAGLLSVPPRLQGTIGGATVTGNHVTDGSHFIDWLHKIEPVEDTNTVSGNVLGS